MGKDNQHQQPNALQAEAKSVQHPVHQYLPQQEFQKTGLSVQDPSSSNNDIAAIVEHQIMIQLSGALSEEDKVMVIIKMMLNLMQQNGC
jgi:hypothetical protein